MKGRKRERDRERGAELQRGMGNKCKADSIRLGAERCANLNFVHWHRLLPREEEGEREREN